DGIYRNCMFGRGVHNGRWSRNPVLRVCDRSRLLQQEAWDADRPREDGFPSGQQSNLQPRRARHLHERDAAPVSTFKPEVTPAQHARIRLTNGAAELVLTSTARAATTGNRGPGQLKLPA